MTAPNASLRAKVDAAEADRIAELVAECDVLRRRAEEAERKARDIAVERTKADLHVEELKAALRYFTKRLSRNSLHPDDYAALQIADAVLRSDRKEDQ